MSQFASTDLIILNADINVLHGLEMHHGAMFITLDSGADCQGMKQKKMCTITYVLPYSSVKVIVGYKKHSR